MFEGMNEREKLIYWAGILDGEGCMKLATYGGGLRPMIQLNMTCEKTVRAFADHFGMIFRELNSPSRIKKRVELGHKQLYHARCECKKAYKVIKEVYPFLITKKEDARVCLNYYDDRECTICKGPIPYTKGKSSVVCSPECYHQYKINLDAERRIKAKLEKEAAIARAKEQLREEQPKEE